MVDVPLLTASALMGTVEADLREAEAATDAALKAPEGAGCYGHILKANNRIGFCLGLVEKIRGMLPPPPTIAPPVVPAEASTALDAALSGDPDHDEIDEEYEPAAPAATCPGCGELYEHCLCDDDDELDEWEDAEDDDDEEENLIIDDEDDSESLRRHAVAPLPPVPGPADDSDLPGFPDAFPHQAEPRLIKAEVL